MVDEVPSPVQGNLDAGSSLFSATAGPLVPRPGGSPVPPEILIGVALGWRMFPLRAGTKTGYYLTAYRDGRTGYSWQQQATNDIVQVTRWAAEYPGCNWGLATGQESGVWVIDPDSKKGHDWVVERGLTDTYVVKTGGGEPEKVLYAMQCYFKHPGLGFRIKNSIKGKKSSLADGVDVRGDGGYVLIVPSVTEHPYRVLKNREITKAPQWLLDLVIAKTPDEYKAATKDGYKGAESTAAAAPPAPPVYLSPLTPEDSKYALDTFSEDCQEFQSIVGNNQGRHQRLYDLAFKAGTRVVRGAFTPEFAQAELMKAAVNFIAHRDHSKAEALRQIDRGLQQGYETPWINPFGVEAAEIAFCPGGVWQPLAAGAGQASPPAMVPVTPTVYAARTGRLLMPKASSIKPKQQKWLWEGWLPQGAFTMFAGMGGIGKSQVTLSWAKTVSTGGQWPDGSWCKEPGDVVIWNSEDAVEETIVPRLIAAGANMDRVRIITGGEGGLPFIPSKDLDLLKNTIEAEGLNVKLLILDPIAVAVDAKKGDNSSIRHGLQPLLDFTARLGCNLLGIGHFGKPGQGKSRNPTDRVLDSVAWVNAARNVLVAAQDRKHENGDCVVTNSKINIAKKSAGYKYRIESTSILGPDMERITGVARILWLEAVQGTAEEIMASMEPGDGEGGGDGRKIGQAKRDLEIALSKEPRTKEQLITGLGYSERTLWRAKKELGITTKTIAGVDYWALSDFVESASDVGLAPQMVNDAMVLLPVISGAVPVITDGLMYE